MKYGKLFEVMNTEIKAFAKSEFRPEIKGCGVSVTIENTADLTDGMFESISFSFDKKDGKLFSYGTINPKYTEKGLEIKDYLQLNYIDYNGPFYRRQSIDEIIKELHFEIVCQLEKQDPKQFKPLFDITGLGGFVSGEIKAS